MICDRAIELLDKDVVLTPYSAFTDQIYWALHVWGELDQVKQYFASQLHHYADRRIRFLRVYLGVRRPFALWKDEIYEPISKLVDIHKLYQWLDPDYGLSSRELISTDPLTFKPPPYTDEEIALRFKWVYDAANPPSTNQTSQDGVQLALH